MQIRESAEDYLESILMLQNEHGYARSVDIANGRGVTKASVSVAMKQLRENGYISMAPDGAITLEDKGRAIAEKTYERHLVLTKMLESLGVEPKTAEHDACKLEHDLSDESFDVIKKHMEERLSNEA